MTSPTHLITDKSYLAPLEGIRGVAALCVVSLHFSKVFFGSDWTPFGYLAVDFFFILSGFIISRQYEARIALRTVSFKKFAIRRIARLYPLYIITIAVYMVIHTYLILPILKFNDMDFGIGPSFLYHILLQLTMLGNLTVMPQPNGPVWSVSVEWIVNLGFFALVWYFRNIPNLLLYALIGFGSFYIIAITPLSLDTPGHDISIIRGVVGFTMGSLIFRYHQRLPKVSSIPLLIFEIALIAACAALLHFHDTPYVISSDYVFQLLIFPLLIIVCLYRKSLIGWFFSLWQCRFLGRISYSVYLWHHPLAFFMTLSPLTRSIESPWLGGFFIFALIILSALSYYCIELPGRWVGRRLTR